MWKCKRTATVEIWDKHEPILFRNTAMALYTIMKNASKDGAKVRIHADVDMDGIGSALIVERVLSRLFACEFDYIINKDKVHGISAEQIRKANADGVELLIIVDSSSNEVPTIIEEAQMDVVVFDHHVIETAEKMCGKTKAGTTYAVVSNMIDSDQEHYDATIKWMSDNTIAKVNGEVYTVDSRMSCGLVIYEFLETMVRCMGEDDLLLKLLLHQWVFVTLITDVVEMDNDRNQWYASRTLADSAMNSTLKIVMDGITSFKKKLVADTIAYTLAPVVNKAIRGGGGEEALNIVLNEPQQIGRLKIYATKQDDIMKEIFKGDIRIPGSWIAYDITGKGISNYSGVIASRLSGDGDANAVVYTVENGIARGSFRGRRPSVDYREALKANGALMAQGHEAAFGFEAAESDVPRIMQALEAVEQNMGMATSTNVEARCNNDEEFEQIMKSIRALALGNAKVAAPEKLYIEVPLSMVRLEDTHGKLFTYYIGRNNVKAKAFNMLSTDWVRIYPEFEGTVEIFVQNA